MLIYWVSGQLCVFHTQTHTKTHMNSWRNSFICHIVILWNCPLYCICHVTSWNPETQENIPDRLANNYDVVHVHLLFISEACCVLSCYLAAKMTPRVASTWHHLGPMSLSACRPRCVLPIVLTGRAALPTLLNMNPWTAKFTA